MQKQCLSRAEKESLLDELEKRRALKSLYFFARNVLGYDLEETPHRELCDFIQSEGSRYKLVLLPRGSYKTSVISQAYPLWKIVKNPDIRILLDSETLPNSLNNLEVIKQHMEKGRNIRRMFGVFRSKKWTQENIVVSTRQNLTLRDPTVATASLEGRLVSGPHYDLIIPDDLHSAENSKTKSQIDQVYERFQLYFTLLEPEGEIIVVGTRWADLDLYGRIMENHREFRGLIRPALFPGGMLYFPSRLTHEFLETQKAKLGLALFNSQYQNNPLPAAETAGFKKEWFRYDGNKDVRRIYIGCDPALPGDARYTDNSAIAAGGLDSKNNLVLVDYAKGKWQPYEFIARIFEMADKFDTEVLHGGAIGIETNVFQRLFKYEIERECKKRRKFYRVVELKHQAQKEHRIMSLQPLYANGSVYHAPWMQSGDLEEELLWFPRGRHDDLIDAFASVLEMCRPAGGNKRVAMTAEEITAETDKAYKDIHDYPLKDYVKKRPKSWAFDEIDYNLVG